MPQRQFGRYLAWAVAYAVLMRGDESQSAAGRPGAAKDETQGQAGRRPSFQAQVIAGDWHPKEEKHRTKERQFWRATLVLYSLTFLAGAAAAAFAAGAYLQAKRQADVAQEALYATYHPVIDVKIADTVLGSANNGFRPSVSISIFSGNDRSFNLQSADAVITSGKDLMKAETISDFCTFGLNWRISPKTGGEKAVCRSGREVRDNDSMNLKLVLHYRDEIGTNYAQKLTFYYEEQSAEWQMFSGIDMNMENRFGADEKRHVDLD